jgi:hypothetical protein
MLKNTWFTGLGKSLSIEEILRDIDAYTEKGGNIFIGTDSQIKADHCIFASAICFHGAPGSSGGRYFFTRQKDNRFPRMPLRARIMQEAQHSIDIALHVFEHNPSAEIEIHIDVGTGIRSKTREYVDALRGWTTSTGFPCKVKPNAWASASVADKHTK